MKKNYIAPEVKIYSVKPADIIATSTTLGTGSTDFMHAPNRDFLDDFGEYE